MKAAFFDVDGTLTTTRVWQGVMDYFRVHNSRRLTHVVFTTYHYPLYMLWKARLISEKGARVPWAAHLGWYFKGFSVDDGKEIWDWIISEFMKTSWRYDILAVLDKHLTDGDFVALVSGGPSPLLERIGEEIGVDNVIGTDFEIIDGLYTGRTLGEVCIDDQKEIQTRQYLDALGVKVDLNASFAYADSITDLPLLRMVGNPVAVYPFENLQVLANRQGWQVIQKRE